MNQVEAASPTLRHYKIYFPPLHDTWANTNEMRGLYQGMSSHPRVTWVDRPEIADYLIFTITHMFDRWAPVFRPIVDRYKEKSIMLDYSDEPWVFIDLQDFRWRLYLKRSCVDRETGQPLEYVGAQVLPTTYCVLDDIAHPLTDVSTRELDLSCLFDNCIYDDRVYRVCRGRLLQSGKRLAKAHPKRSMQIGCVSPWGPEGRIRVDPRYKRCLYSSKIVLTANPDPWEGDARLWEALGSGALVFTDRMCAPIPNGLVDGQHLVYFDLSDKGLETLEEKVAYYLNNDAERERIARQGREFVLRKHRPVNRIDEILAALENTEPNIHLSRPSVERQNVLTTFGEARQEAERWRPTSR